MDTCDIDELSATTTPEQGMTTSTTSIASAGEGEVLPPVATRPERLYKFIHDVVATPQYAKERHLLVGNCKPNTTLMVSQILLLLLLLLLFLLLLLLLLLLL